MYTCITTGAISGLESCPVKVEVDVSPGLPCFQMVGYLSSEVREARERVRVALKNTGFALPAMCINVNLSPANLRKEGTSYDLPLALGILTALGDIDGQRLEDTLVIGELGLNGEVKPVRGILPIVRAARESGIKRAILPAANSAEGSIIPGIEIIGVRDLASVYSLLTGDSDMASAGYTGNGLTDTDAILQNALKDIPDFSEVRGQTAIKRAATVAAAGFHHMLMIGPPGAGKTMIAKRIPGILPPLTMDESLEVTSIYSIAGLLDEDKPVISTRPFLSPHHTITEQGLSGGGAIPRPGIISLAHRGVLFLDELTEYNRATLDIMRQPLEDRVIYISRSHGTFRYPADFMLVAACNPCPCGYFPDLNKCHCTESQVKRYLGRISGPLLDRIDICCDVDPVDIKQLSLSDEKGQMTSGQMRELVMAARERQEFRFKDRDIRFNSEMTGRDIDSFCRLEAAEQAMMENAFSTLNLSARSYHRILRTSRTIADLDDSEKITEEHLAEAIIYRTNGSRYWGG